MLTVLDLFSGIGGMSLGLERTGGFKTVAFCEINEYCRRVLAKHWPGVLCFNDVRSLSAHHLTAAGIAVNVICGGFPCQNVSLAGDGTGLGGEQSGLWFEMCRLIDEFRPSWVIAENVPALRTRGLDDVLRGLSALGYDAEWHCIPASAVGACHRRDRIWVIAYTSRFRCGEGRPRGLVDCIAGLPHAPRWDGQDPVDYFEGRENEPALLGVDDGLPAWMDRVFALGNSLDPAIPELIGRAILDAAPPADRPAIAAS